ncbi:MAG: hypothetical protein IKI35_08070, partial [Stomatobaculum sp.]|nr:hypothetical protein [Stomatobaculum sp.]
MAEFAIEKLDNNEAYFTCGLQGDEQPDRFAIGMLSNNTISRIITPELEESEEQISLRCRVDGLVPMEEYFKDGISRSRTFKVLRTCAEAILSGKDYMLEEDHFLLQPKMMFADPETGEAELIYLAVDGFRNKLSFRRCIQKLIVNAVYEESEDLSYVAKLINGISRCKDLNAGTLLGILSELEKEKVQMSLPEEEAAPPVMIPPQNEEPETGRETAPAAVEDPDDDKTWIDPDSLTWGTSQGGGAGEIGWDAAPQQGWGSQGAAPQPDWGSQGAAPQQGWGSGNAFPGPGEEDPDNDKTWIDPDSLTWGTSQGGASGEIGWDAAPQQGWGSQGAAP